MVPLGLLHEDPLTKNRCRSSRRASFFLPGTLQKENRPSSSDRSWSEEEGGRARKRHDAACAGSKPVPLFCQSSKDKAFGGSAQTLVVRHRYCIVVSQVQIQYRVVSTFFVVQPEESEFMAHVRSGRLSPSKSISVGLLFTEHEVHAMIQSILFIERDEKS